MGDYQFSFLELYGLDPETMEESASSLGVELLEAGRGASIAILPRLEAKTLKKPRWRRASEYQSDFLAAMESRDKRLQATQAMAWIAIAQLLSAMWSESNGKTSSRHIRAIKMLSGYCGLPESRQQGLAAVAKYDGEFRSAAAAGDGQISVNELGRPRVVTASYAWFMRSIFGGQFTPNYSDRFVESWLESTDSLKEFVPLDIQRDLFSDETEAKGLSAIGAAAKKASRKAARDEKVERADTDDLGKNVRAFAASWILEQFKAIRDRSSLGDTGALEVQIEIGGTLAEWLGADLDRYKWHLEDAPDGSMHQLAARVLNDRRTWSRIAEFLAWATIVRSQDSWPTGTASRELDGLVPFPCPPSRREDAPGALWRDPAFASDPGLVNERYWLDVAVDVSAIVRGIAPESVTDREGYVIEHPGSPPFALGQVASSFVSASQSLASSRRPNP